MRDRAKQRAVVRAWLRKTRVRLRAEGICTGCMKRPVRTTLPGSKRRSTICGECAEAQKVRARARVARLKLAGICTLCGRQSCRADCFKCERCAPSRAGIVRKALRTSEENSARMMELAISLGRKGRAA